MRGPCNGREKGRFHALEKYKKKCSRGNSSSCVCGHTKVPAKCSRYMSLSYVMGHKGTTAFSSNLCYPIKLLLLWCVYCTWFGSRLKYLLHCHVCVYCTWFCPPLQVPVTCPRVCSARLQVLSRPQVCTSRDTSGNATSQLLVKCVIHTWYNKLPLTIGQSICYSL